VPVVSFSVPTPLRFEDALVLKMEERVHAIGAFDINIPAFASVATARTASGDKLFPSKGKTAIPSISRDDLYFSAIDKQARSSV
jgi:hypothetical protein